MPSLYHYTKIETFLNYIALSATLKTNSLEQMNDPRESVKWAFSGTNVPYESIFEGYNNDKTHIDCQYKLGERIKDQFQIACFSGAKLSGWDNEMMWAHYGGLHTGICLEFDEHQLSESIKRSYPNSEFHIGNVDYNGEIEAPWLYWNGRECYEHNISTTIKRIYKEVIFTKSHFWEKEDERRLVVFSSEYVFVPINQSLKRVYVGLNFNHQIQLPELFDAVDQLGADLAMLSYENYKFKRWGLRKDTGGIRSYNID